MKPTQPHTAKINKSKVYWSCREIRSVLQQQEEGPKTSITYKNTKVLSTYVAFKAVKTFLMFIINEQDILLTISYESSSALLY